MADNYDELPLTPPTIPMPATAQATPDEPSAGSGDFDLASLPPDLQQHLQEEALQEKYGGTTDQIKAGLEGIAEGVAGPLAPLAEKAMGVKEEDIRGRKEANPWTHGIGQATGLIGSLATGVGEGALMAKAGQAAVEGLGIAKAATPLARVGSEVVRQGIENMVLQGGDEISKMVLHDPQAGAENAIANIGLAGVLGGAFGGAMKGTGELWAVTGGKKLGALIDGIRGRANTGTKEIVNEAPNAVIQGMEDVGNAQMGATTDAAGNIINANREGQNAIIQGMEDTGNAILDSQKQMAEALGRLENRPTGPDFADRIREGAAKASKADLDTMVARGLAEGPPPSLRQMADVDIPASLEAALGDNPETRMRHSLMQSGTAAGDRQVQEDVATFRKNLSRKAEESLGFAEGDLAGIPNISERNIGTAVHKDIVGPVQDAIDTVAPKFEEFKKIGEKVAISDDAMALGADKLFQAGIDAGWDKVPGSAEYKLWKRAIEELPLQKTAADLAKYATHINDLTKREQMWDAGRVLRKFFRDATDDAIEAGLGREAGSKVAAEFRIARQDYGRLMDYLDRVGDAIGIRGAHGPAGFMQELQEVARSPEKMLRKLQTDKNANLGAFLAEQFPEASAKIDAYERVELARKALNPDRETINIKKLGKEVAGLSPEFRERVLGKGAAERIAAIEALERRIPEKYNKSGTGGYIENMISKMSPSGLGMAATMVGGPVVGATALALKKIQEYVGKEAPSAIRLAMLKNLSSEAATNPTAFKAMVEYIHQSVKGETAFVKASKAVFDKSSKVLIDSQIPTKQDREKLDKEVSRLQDKPGIAMQTAADSQVGHYMPEGQAALSQASLTALQYLQGLKPHPQKLGPLDKEIEPTPAQMARYNRALDIAQSPMIVLDHVKQGTVQVTDLQDLKAMYPALYARTAQKLSNDMIHASEQGVLIPYKTRLGISLFLGQPVDSSMQPMSIQSAQGTFAPTQSPQGGGATPADGSKITAKAGTSLEKGAKSYQTPGQQAASARERGRS